MADLEFRDLSDHDDKPYLTKPTSQVDLERRLNKDYKPDGDLSLAVTVNPNPFGQEDYAGTDPIYQNHANDTEAPLAADEGPDKEAEDAVKALYEGSDDDVLVPDFGLGGEATLANTDGPEATRMLVPGQEGYPDNPEQFVGPAVPASAVEQSKDSDKESAGEAVEAAQPSVQPPASPAAPVTQAGTTPDAGSGGRGQNNA